MSHWYEPVQIARAPMVMRNGPQSSATACERRSLELVINLKTAAALKIDIPATLLVLMR
jgi:hypothetical protein